MAPASCLSSYAGRPLLVVNTASHCGYTPQYTGLQTLWSRYRDRGLMVIGVPSNDFGGQEPGGATEIGKTAQGEYHVTFPLAAKVAVKGLNAHPFYRWAAQERPQEAPRWNFPQISDRARWQSARAAMSRRWSRQTLALSVLSSRKWRAPDRSPQAAAAYNRQQLN